MIIIITFIYNNNNRIINNIYININSKVIVIL